MVQGTLRAEREALERMGTELRAELGHLREWRVREEAMRADQTALYRRAAEEWRTAAESAGALHASNDELAGASRRSCEAVVDAAGARFWRRAMLAAWLVALVGTGPGRSGYAAWSGWPSRTARRRGPTTPRGEEDATLPARRVDAG